MAKLWYKNRLAFTKTPMKNDKQLNIDHLKNNYACAEKRLEEIKGEIEKIIEYIKALAKFLIKRNIEEYKDNKERFALIYDLIAKSKCVGRSAKEMEETCPLIPAENASEDDFWKFGQCYDRTSYLHKNLKENPRKIYIDYIRHRIGKSVLKILEEDSSGFPFTLSPEDYYQKVAIPPCVKITQNCLKEIQKNPLITSNEAWKVVDDIMPLESVWHHVLDPLLEKTEKIITDIRKQIRYNIFCPIIFGETEYNNLDFRRFLYTVGILESNKGIRRLNDWQLYPDSPPFDLNSYSFDKLREILDEKGVPYIKPENAPGDSDVLRNLIKYVSKIKINGKNIKIFDSLGDKVVLKRTAPGQKYTAIQGLKVIDEDGKKWVVKMLIEMADIERIGKVPEQLETIKRLFSEFDVLSKFNEIPEIPKVASREEFMEGKEKVHYFAKEFIEGEHIAKLTEIKDYPVKQVLEITLDLLSILSKIHDKGYIYQDISATNILTNNNKINMYDFDSIVCIGEDNSVARVDTFPYVLPEYFDRYGIYDNIYRFFKDFYIYIAPSMDIPPMECVEENVKLSEWATRNPNDIDCDRNTEKYPYFTPDESECYDYWEIGKKLYRSTKNHPVEIAYRKFVQDNCPKDSTFRPYVDLYKVGLLMYQLLKGVGPEIYISIIKGARDETLEEIKNGSINKTAGNLPTELKVKISNIIDKATASNYKDRYQSATEMQNDILEVLKNL